MENRTSKTAASEIGGLADRASEAANAVGSHASDALDEVKAAGQGLLDDYREILSREKKRAKKAIKGATDSARENTFLLAGGALVVGLLLGHVLTRRSE